MRQVSHRAWDPCVWNSEQFSLCWKRSCFIHLHAVWSFNTVLQWHRWTNISGCLRLRWYDNSKSYILDIGVLGFHVYHRFTFKQLKCLWNEIFYYLIQKSFQNDKEWRLFYCDSTLGCWVIQDFDLCKLDDLWRHNVDTKWCKITKNWISLTTFSV